MSERDQLVEPRIEEDEIGTDKHNKFRQLHKKQTACLFFLFFLIVAAIFSLMGFAIAHHKAADRTHYPLVINTWHFINATRTAWTVLQRGGIYNQSNALDALELGCNYCEDHPWECDFTVGYGGSPNENGVTTIDAMVMWAPTHQVGAVGYMKNISHGISVARKVMEETYHTMLVAEEATQFAIEMGFKPRDLTTERSYNMWHYWATVGNHTPNYWVHHHNYPNVTTVNPEVKNKRESHSVSSSHNNERHGFEVGPGFHDTIGMITIDKDGNMACGTSSNGMTFKIAGRVGDAPIIGSGAYCDDDVGGAVETGDGDVMMRFSPTVRVVEAMRNGKTPTEACQGVIDSILKYYPKASGAIIAVNKRGEYGGAFMNIPNGFPFVIQRSHMADAKIVTLKQEEEE